MEEKYTEADWKLFRRKLPEWQEHYMEKLIQEYSELLSQEKKASGKFWALEKRIKKDSKKTGVICEMRRSMLIPNVIELVHEGVITLDDIEEFSQNFKDTIRIFTE